MSIEIFPLVQHVVVLLEMRHVESYASVWTKDEARNKKLIIAVATTWIEENIAGLSNYMYSDVVKNDSRKKFSSFERGTAAGWSAAH